MALGEAGMILDVCATAASLLRVRGLEIRFASPVGAFASARTDRGSGRPGLAVRRLYPCPIRLERTRSLRARGRAGGTAGLAGGRRRADDPDDRAAGPVKILGIRRRRSRDVAGGGRQAGRGERPHHPAARPRPPPVHQHATALWRRAAARRAAVKARSCPDQCRPACRRRRLCQPGLGRIPDRRGASRQGSDAARTGFWPSPFRRRASGR